MPLYTFSCPQCGHTVDVPLTIAERDTDIRCKLCKQSKLESHMERRPTSASFTINGYNEKNGYSGSK